MIDIQGLMEVISSTARDTRKDYHVLLGQLIEDLGQADPNALVYYQNPHSYRGYYADLALEPTDDPIKIWQLTEQLKRVLDTTLCGYKGGDFLMSADTPVWIAHYGDTGMALVAFHPNSVTFTTRKTRY